MASVEQIALCERAHRDPVSDLWQITNGGITRVSRSDFPGVVEVTLWFSLITDELVTGSVTTLRVVHYGVDGDLESETSGSALTSGDQPRAVPGRYEDAVPLVVPLSKPGVIRLALEVNDVELAEMLIEVAKD
jgi:hypothetical protein